jgi:hypothetical protein
MLFQLVQVVYWLALSTWFGGVLFIAVAQQVIFRTVRENKPMLPHVLSVNLEGQHGTLLAGTIVASLITALARIELVCAGVLLAAIGGQWFLIDLTVPWNKASAFVRSGLYLAATFIVIYDWRFLWPRISKYRQEFIENADEPEKANPALEQLNRYQRESISLLSILVFLLLGIVLFSSGITGQSVTFTNVTAPR